MKAKKDNTNQQLISTKLKVVFYLVLPMFFLGVCLTMYAINLYRETIIHWSIPFIIWLASGLFILPITYRLLKEPREKSDTLWQLIYNCLTFGGIMYYMLMTINYHFPSNTNRYRKINIIEKGSLSSYRSCGNPYTEVLINGIKKDLIFECGTNIDQAKYVEIELQKGLLGFDIIVKKTLKDE